MKIGINHWTFPMDMTLRESFALARRVGCDTMEVNLAETGELSLETSEAEARAIANAAAEEGIELSSLSTSLYWKTSPSSNDPAVRVRSGDILERQLRVARWLGVDTVLVVPGAVTADVSYDVAYDRAHALATRALPIARETGVGIGIENVWNKFLLSPLEMRDFVDLFADPLVGVYFDAGNILASGYPQHWIRILGHRIRKVHVKDYDDDVPGMGGFRNLLQGSVPWAEVRTALREIGYDGPVTAEVTGYPAFPELGLRHIAECLRAIVSDAPPL